MRQTSNALSLRRERREEGCSLDAAALQRDMAKRFNLPGAAVKRIKYLACSPSVRSSGSGGRSSLEHRCPSCSQIVLSSESVCPNCGIFFRSLGEYEPTLAETRGLVPRSQPPTIILKLGDWLEIESRLFKRKESVCPICMENFKQGHEVLLSCSHMYHR